MNRRCQIFTPNDYVNELLDCVGYIDNLYGKRILENSCGDGNVLVVIVKRYIEACRTQGFSDDQIRAGLEQDVYGVEIDPVQYNKCISNLDEAAKEKGIIKVKWNLVNTDYLRWMEPLKFQFVVGNPPYITYQKLKKKERDFVKKNFESCESGKFDYCYAFIEKSIECLAMDGRMSYLIPSSIFKTVSGEKLRENMKPYLKDIRDYTQNKMFNDALVKSAIMVLDKQMLGNVLHYYDMAKNQKMDIPHANLTKKWFFTVNNTPGTRRFGDYFQVSHVVATLLNKAFVIKKENYNEINGFYQCNGHNIEKELIRETAAPRSLRYHKVEKIIFPYKYENGKLVRYTEAEFKQNFPGANAYLADFREQLDKRESDKGALWFEYGRSQALAGLNRRKLLISTVVTEKVTVYTLKKKCIPYAGMYITPKSENKIYKLEDAKKILESKEFMAYAETVGVHISGTSLRITSRDIENYKF